MSNNIKLNSTELEFIKDREIKVVRMLKNLQRGAEFKVGDFLIGFDVHYEAGVKKRRQMINTYFAPKKFQVVYVDGINIPYLKELTKDGKHAGRLISPVRLFNESSYSVYMADDCEFQLDPDYADAVIMMDEEAYDPVANHKDKSKDFKEIKDHNKANKIPNNGVELEAYFNGIAKVGDTIYNSRGAHFTIIEMNALPFIPKHLRNKYNGRTGVDYHTAFCKVITSKGTTEERDLNSFRYKSMYKTRPRSYKELKNLK